MKTYHFALWLQGVKEITEELENKVFKAGCDDALLGAYFGRLFLEFDRRAESLLAAVKSALQDAAKAGMSVERIGLYDFVTAAEIARRTHRSRASITQLINGERGPGRFPDPYQTVGSNLVWSWPDVEDWFANYDGECAIRADERELRAIDCAYQFLRRVPNKRARNRILDELDLVGT
jgi:predicted DNA-binding transcriptional regulator AlpA